MSVRSRQQYKNKDRGNKGRGDKQVNATPDVMYISTERYKTDTVKYTLPKTVVNVLFDRESQQEFFNQINKHTISNSGEGNCFFWSIIQAINKDFIKSTYLSNFDRPDLLRNELVTILLEYYNQEEHRILRTRFADESELFNFCQKLHLDKTWKELDNGTWGFDIILYILANYTTTNIVLFIYDEKNKNYKSVVYCPNMFRDNKKRCFI